MAAVQSVPPASTIVVVRLVPAWAGLEEHNRNEAQAAKARQERRRMKGSQNKNNERGWHLRSAAPWGFKPHGMETKGRKPSQPTPILAQLLHFDPVEHPGPCRRDGERRGGVVCDPRPRHVRGLQECAVGPTQGEAAAGELDR